MLIVFLWICLCISTGGSTSSRDSYAATADVARDRPPAAPPMDHEYVNTGPKGKADPKRGYVNLAPGGEGSSPMATDSGHPEIGVEVPEGELGSQYQALCDYHTMAPGVLSFSEGDIALLMQIKGQGWWKVKMNGQTGWVPASYFEKEVNSMMKLVPLFSIC